jgi:Uma2 family endonuclease
MAVPQEIMYTIEDIYDLPDGERAELIDGTMYMMSPPNMIHQRLSSKIHFAIMSYIAKKGGACEVFAAPFAVFLNNDDTTYVEPDISVICDNTKLTKKGCNGAPDWVIEIVSPSSRQMDYFVKLFKYQMSGVREYWIVNPEKETVRVYNFVTETTEDYTFEDTISVGIYEDLEIDFSKML